MDYCIGSLIMLGVVWLIIYEIIINAYRQDRRNQNDRRRSDSESFDYKPERRHGKERRKESTRKKIITIIQFGFNMIRYTGSGKNRKK